MDCFPALSERGSEEEALGELDFKKNKKYAFQSDHRQTCYSTKRRRSTGLVQAFFLLNFLGSRCYGFLVCEPWKQQPSRLEVEPCCSVGVFPAIQGTPFYATKTVATWRERLYSKTPILMKKKPAVYPLKDCLVIVEDDDRECESETGDPTILTETKSENNRDEETSGKGAKGENSDELIEIRNKAAARAALSVKRPSSRSAGTAKSTSVGSRRVGSATVNRQGVRATSQIMNVLRKTAQATTSDATKMDPPNSLSARVSQSIIHTAIDEILRRRDAPVISPSFADSLKLTAAFSSFGRRIRVMGDVLEDSLSNKKKHKSLRIQTELLKASETTDQVSVRLAGPVDDVDIARLRLSVFSDFPPELQSQFCARSCQAIAARRLRGATCVVATKPYQDSVPGSQSSVTLGSAECSFHEFFGTRIGHRRHRNTILYVTEVAVNPSFRRSGIGSKILQALDTLAEHRGVETFYLHVDVANQGALNLYEKAGYRKVLSTDPMFQEFTTSLNLHPGATRGREHFLLYKNLVQEPTWLDDGAATASYRAPPLGKFGFEIPA